MKEILYKKILLLYFSTIRYKDYGKQKLNKDTNDKIDLVVCVFIIPECALAYKMNVQNWINFQKGRPAAISAMARKLAVIIWNMGVKIYRNDSVYEFLDQKRKRKVFETKNSLENSE